MACATAIRSMSRQPNVESIVPMPKLVSNGDAAMDVDAPKKLRGSSVGNVASTPVYVFSGGGVKSNEKLTEMTNKARTLLRETVEQVNKVQMWIVFLIPRIEDGNNFGVSIQEETLNEVRTVEAGWLIEEASEDDEIRRLCSDTARHLRFTRAKRDRRSAKAGSSSDLRPARSQRPPINQSSSSGDNSSIERISSGRKSSPFAIVDNDASSPIHRVSSSASAVPRSRHNTGASRRRTQRSDGSSNSNNGGEKEWRVVGSMKKKRSSLASDVPFAVWILMFVWPLLVQLAYYLYKRHRHNLMHIFMEYM